MATPDPCSPDLPKWVAAFATFLRSTKVKFLVRVAPRIEHVAVRLTRKRFVAVLIALVAFVVAVKPMVATIGDGVNFFGKHFLGWGVCYELVPSETGFRGTSEKRTCHPGAVAAFKWRYPFDKDACDACENRAFALGAVEQSGRSRWVELYMKKSAPGGPQDWGAAHNWIVVDPQANRGSGSYKDYFSDAKINRHYSIRMVGSESLRLSCP
jgi:hypothetical protein